MPASLRAVTARLLRASGVTRLTAVAASAIIISQIALLGDYQVDDAYISFAFAKNLAAGHGLTYGSGLRVEGYSNFLWVVAAALVQLIAPTHLYLGMQVVALGCLALMLRYVYRLGVLGSNPLWAGAMVVALACATDFTGAALSALETMAQTAALVGAVYYYVTEAPTRRRASAWWLLLLALVRIDGIVHFAFFLGFTALSWLLEWRRPRAAETLRWLGLPALVYAAYFAARYFYYGLPLPTTYYAKSLIPELLPDRGTDYLLNASRQLCLPVAGAFALVAVLLRRTRVRLLLALLVLSHSAYVRHVGGDWMPFHRFLVPVLPFVTVLAGWGMFDLWQLVRQRAWYLRFSVGSGLLYAAGYVALFQNGYSINTQLERDELNACAQIAQHTHDLVAARRLFQWVTRTPGERLVTDYGGVLAYYTDADIIEMWGLCNADIALRGNTEGINPIYGKTCVKCYSEFHPDYFHANVPLMRPVGAAKNVEQTIPEIFQGAAIDQVLDFRSHYVAGRVVEDDKLAFYFLERKRPGLSYAPRQPAPHITVEYPCGD